jgi:hypothetical protein
MVVIVLFPASAFIWCSHMLCYFLVLFPFFLFGSRICCALVDVVMFWCCGGYHRFWWCNGGLVVVFIGSYAFCLGGLVVW